MPSSTLFRARFALNGMPRVRVLLVSATNGAAVGWFIAAGAVRWPETLAMLVASIAGGYLGSRLTQRLPGPVVRWFVVALTATVTVAFFVRVL